MGFWTKVGMVCGGVAAAALAIPTGGTSVIAFTAMAVSTGTAVAIGAGCAVAGAAAGAGIGYAIDKKKSQEEIEKVKAKDAERIKKLEKQIEKLCNSMNQANAHYQSIIALVAFGLAALKAVGNISNESKQNIEEFVMGISRRTLPDSVKEKIASLKRKIPTMHEAFAEAKKVAGIPLDDYKEVILLAIDDSNGNSCAGKAFMDAWNKEKEAAA